MRIEQIHIYTIEELQELDKVAYEKAMKNIEERRMNDFSDHYSYEVLTTLQRAAEHFHMEVANWSFGLWDRSWVSVNYENYMDLDHFSKHSLVQWLNENLVAGKQGSCPFTGVIYDCYFFDLVAELTDGAGVTYNNLHKIVPEAIQGALLKILDEEEDNISNEEYNREYAINNELEFTQYGEFY